MDILQNNNKKIAIAVALVAILTLILFVIVWKSKTKQSAQTQPQTTAGTAGLPTGLSAPPEMPKIETPAEVTSISGTVEKIEGKILTVKAFFFGEQKIYTVTVGSATKIQKSEMKKEIPKPEAGKPVEPFTLTDASFSDISQNDNLTIEASENIKDKTGFEAKTVTINIMNLPDASTPPKIENLPAPPTPPDFPALPKINK